MSFSNETPQGALDLLVLKTLQPGPNHGFAITLHIQTASEGVLRVEEGSLYPALHRMERQGLLHSEWTVTESGRRARFYALTDQGRQQLEREERRWQAVNDAIGKVLRFA